MTQRDVTTQLLATVGALTRTARTVACATSAEVAAIRDLVQAANAATEDLRLVDAIARLEAIEAHLDRLAEVARQ